jgi:hypothetical protein
MKLAGAIGTAVLSLTLGIGIPAFAQQDQHDQQENKDKQAPEKEKNAQPEKAGNKEVKDAPANKNERPQEKTAQGHPQPKPEEHASARIPEDRFRANFGQEHRFRVSEADYRNGRRFQYGGYWFGFVQPWPSNWLYTQNVYVIETNGVYYLCNESYPGVNVTLSVTL